MDNVRAALRRPARRQRREPARPDPGARRRGPAGRGLRPGRARVRAGVDLAGPAGGRAGDLQAITEAALALAAAGAGARSRAPPQLPHRGAPVGQALPAASLEIGVPAGRRGDEATGVPVDLHTRRWRWASRSGQHGAFVYADNRARARRAAGGHLGPGAAAAVGRDRFAGGRLAGGQARPGAATALYFHSPPFVGEKSRDKVAELARTLARWQALRQPARWCTSPTARSACATPARPSWRWCCTGA